MFELTRKQSNIGIGLIVWVCSITSLWAKWEIQTVDSIGDVGVGSAIALDKNSYPHISYWDRTSKHLKYARWNGTSWEIQIVDSDTAISCGVTSLSLDKSGYPNISYSNGKIKYARWDGTNWKTQVVDSTAGGGYNSMALNSNGYPRISYTVGNRGLKYAYWDGITWNTEVVDSGDVGDNSIALDGNNNPHISYLFVRYYPGWDERYLMYARRDSGNWQIQTVDNSEGYNGAFNSLALDSNGYPHISYTWWDDWRTPTASGIKYAWWDGTAWKRQPVELGVNDNGIIIVPGGYNSLVLDTKNNPHISYQDINYFGDHANTLKYAWQDGASWKIQRVDSEASISDISLALDTAGNPQISYMGYPGYLKYARWVPDGIEEAGLSNALERETFRIGANLFSSSTTIELDIPQGNSRSISLKIYAITGEEVRVLCDGIKNAGRYKLSWDGRNQKGMKLPAGIYFCNLRLNNSTQTKKIIIIN
jgi:hypothetical protein